MTLLFLLLACDAAAEKETCELLCDQLTMECQYGAYPSYDSCLQGCAYEQSEGADMEAQQKCIERAQCDTFEIVECEHKFGTGE